MCCFAYHCVTVFIVVAVSLCLSVCHSVAVFIVVLLCSSLCYCITVLISVLVSLCLLLCYYVAVFIAVLLCRCIYHCATVLLLLLLLLLSTPLHQRAASRVQHPKSCGSQQSLPPGGKERLHFVGIRPEVQARKGGW